MEKKDNMMIPLPLNYRVIETNLLNEILNELESLNGKTLIKQAGYQGMGYVTVFDEDMETLKLDILIGKLKMVLG